MIFILASILIVLLVIFSYLLDRRYPSQRRLILPTISIIMLGIAGFTLSLAPAKPTTLSNEQREAILKQQPKFAEWYGDYQQNIYQIKRFTNAYQKITQNYLEQQISANIAMEQLQRLYQESDDFTKGLDKWQPPTVLNEENTLLTLGIIKTTKNYQYHVNEMIRQSISILHAGIDNSLPYKATSNNLIRIRAIEDPIILDNSKYVYKLRENLYLPNSKKDKKSS